MSNFGQGLFSIPHVKMAGEPHVMIIFHKYKLFSKENYVLVLVVWDVIKTDNLMIILNSFKTLGI